MRDSRDEGATAVEYALMAALIAGVIVAVVFVFGRSGVGALQFRSAILDIWS